MLEIIDLSQEIYPGRLVFPGMPQVKITLHVSNKEVHHICGELGFTHYENLINLHS